MEAVHLTHRAVINISGPDAATFLQGLVSNDVMAASEQQAVYAALLTPQGKFQFDMFIIRSGQQYLLDVEAGHAATLVKLLQRYQLRAQLAITDVSNLYQIYALTCLLADRTIGLHGHSVLFQDPRHADLGFRMLLNSRDVKLLETYSIKSLIEYDKRRLTLGIGDGSRDIEVGSDVLLEANFDLLHGINFNKGCYMGQELTARTHYRGLVKKRLFPVQVVAGEVPKRGSIIYHDKREVGEMRGSSGDRGLAMLRIADALDALDNTIAMECDGAQLLISKPDWMNLPA